MSIELLSILFVVVFIVILLPGVPLAFATGAVAVVFAYALFGLPGLTLIDQPRLHADGQLRARLSAAVHLHGLHPRAGRRRRRDLSRRARLVRAGAAADWPSP